MSGAAVSFDGFQARRRMLVKATLTHLATLKRLQVQWNPRSYSLQRSNAFTRPAAIGSVSERLQLSAGGTDRFHARLFFDSTEVDGPERNLRLPLECLESWAEAEVAGLLPPYVLFLWGSFRFRGVIEELQQECVRFDSDGTPVRAWVDLTLRK